MVQFVKRCSIAIGCFTLMVFSCGSVEAQSQERPQRLIQNAAAISALPASPTTAGVRAGFAPAQTAQSNSNSSTGYQGSFYQRQAATADVYPYPAANRPSGGFASQASQSTGFSQGSSTLSNQIGSNASTGDLRSGLFAQNNNNNNAGFSNAGSAGSSTRTAANSFAQNINRRAPVEQQVSSTLNPVTQARINQAAVDRLRSQQTASNSNSAASASRPPANRTASQANLFGQSGSQATSAFRQPAAQAGSATRNTVPAVRCAQACNCCPQGTIPVTAGFQQGAAFQAPSLNPNVGAGLGLGLNTNGVGSFNQQQCCQPQTGFAGAGFQAPRLPTQGFQAPSFQNNGFQFANRGVGVPQFGAQGARWWTPFTRGTGAYTPLLDLTPNNAGTYLGQGIVGQPTAYVNGQLFRNLLRYLAP